ncbi:MAG: hypothetical protein ABIJ09_19245 [Pseudomonadota bacterium]
MRLILQMSLAASLLLSSLALAVSKPQVEVAPVVGAQFFRGINGPGLGQDQALQNGIILGARGGALFADRLRLDIGLEFTPTMEVGLDRLNYVVQPHVDGSIDLATGWIRPYVGVSAGVIGFIDNEWVGGSLTSLFGEENKGRNPDVEFTGALLLGSRFYLGEMVDMLQGTVLRLDLRDVLYAPRNGAVNYMMESPGALIAFHNPQVTVSFAWTFDASGESTADGAYEFEGAGMIEKPSM